MEENILTGALERIDRYLKDRTTQCDRETFTTSLQQLYTYYDRLYHHLLPEFTHCVRSTSQDITETSPLSRSDWLLFLEITSNIQRLSPLCTLLLEAATASIEALDHSCSLLCTASVRQQLVRIGEDQERTELLAAITTARIPRDSYLSWLQTTSQLNRQMEEWRMSNQQRICLTDIFRSSPEMIQAAEQIDTLFARMLPYATRMFGSLLPEFQTVASGDDETVITLLLDIMQQVDELLSLLEYHSPALSILTHHTVQ